MILLLPRDLMLWCLVLAAALQMCPTCAEMSPGREDGGLIDITQRGHTRYIYLLSTQISIIYLPWGHPVYVMSYLRRVLQCDEAALQHCTLHATLAADASPAHTWLLPSPASPAQLSQPSPAQPSPAQQIFSCWCIKREEESFNVLLGIMEISDTSLSKYIKRLLSL